MTDTNYPTETPNEIIESPKARKIAYRVLAIVGLALAATNAGYGVAALQGAIEEFPLWLGIADGVFPVIASGLGYTAQRNVPVR